MKIALMIMAAGESKRFGGCKLLTSLDETHSLLSYAIRQSLGSGLGPVFVVTGRWHEEIDQAQQQGSLAPVPLLYCPQWSQGLGHAIAYGAGILAPDYDAILITLADQVALRSEDFRHIAASATPEHLVCAWYNERRGVPALFPAACFAHLMALEGESGARHLLRGDVFPVHEIVLPHAAQDIDTPQMLVDWQTVKKPQAS